MKQAYTKFYHQRIMINSEPASGRQAACDHKEKININT